MSPSDNVMTVQEAAAFLRVSVTTLTAEADAGNIPAVRIGKQLRFLESALLDHLRGVHPRGVRGVVEVSAVSAVGCGRITRIEPRREENRRPRTRHARRDVDSKST